MMSVNDMLAYIRHGTPLLFAEEIKVLSSLRSSDIPIFVQPTQDDLISLVAISYLDG